MGSGARSVLDNANLVKKVAFPHEILPLSAVGVALSDFALQSSVLFLLVLASGYGIHLPELALWPLAFVTLLVLTVALSLWFSALNVRYRDVGHLLNIALLVWFWATPIVYSGYQVEKVVFADDIGGAGLFTLYLLNPLVGIVTGFQAAVYGTDLPAGATEPVLFTRWPGEWYAIVLLVVLAASLVLLRLAWGYFFSRSGDFAEEL
jgi:ABC-2 type transport system permease protein